MTSKDIYVVVSNHFNTDISVKSRQRRLIYMRGICNTLCRTFTDESLETIGEWCNSDHATVLHSLNEFSRVYINQDKPFNVLKEFAKLGDIIQKMVDEEEEYKEQRLTPELIENKTIRTLSDRCIDLNSKLKEANEKIKSLDNVNYLKVEKRYLGVLKLLKDMSDADISDLIETRIEPFKKTLESRVKPKVIVKVAGAMLR